VKERSKFLLVATAEDRRRFAARVGEPDEHGCRRWMGCFEEAGYGRYSIRRTTVRAHRVAYFFAHGVLPEVVMHICDNPACVNVEHLRQGTQLENIADRHAKGRNGAAYGERNGSARINAFVADLIRSSSLRTFELSKLFSLSWSSTKRVQVGKTWRRGELGEPSKAG
jgi:HNH endonuclease